MSLFRTLVLPLLIAYVLLAAGCTAPEGNTAAPAPGQPVDVGTVHSSYQITLAQPDARSEYIRMDTDVFNAGEVVEFVVTNGGSRPLECTQTPPDFRVTFQTGSGRWGTKMGPEKPVSGNASRLEKDQSTKVYRFITTGWEPGRYRIISDCGVEREILIRAPPTPVPTRTPCTTMNTTNTTPWIKVDRVGDQYMNRPFTITGTTSFAAGTVLRYTIFSVESRAENISVAPEGSFVTTVQEGTCGSNVWSAMGEIQAAGNFFIGIEDIDRKATAISRFVVHPS